MLFSTLPAALLSALTLNGLGASASVLEERSVVGAVKAAVGNAVGALSDAAPGDLLAYQKTNDKKLRSRVHDLREIALTDKSLPADVKAYAAGKLAFPFKFMSVHHLLRPITISSALLTVTG